MDKNKLTDSVQQVMRQVGIVFYQLLGLEIALSQGNMKVVQNFNDGRLFPAKINRHMICVNYLTDKGCRADKENCPPFLIHDDFLLGLYLALKNTEVKVISVLVQGGLTNPKMDLTTNFTCLASLERLGRIYDPDTGHSCAYPPIECKRGGHHEVNRGVLATTN